MESTEIALSTYLNARDDYQGFCLTCKDLSDDGVEPDAEGYECPNCGAMQVMGIENALLCGHITIK